MVYFRVRKKQPGRILASAVISSLSTTLNVNLFMMFSTSCFLDFNISGFLLRLSFNGMISINNTPSYMGGEVNFLKFECNCLQRM